jgi:3-methyl-2-oxobutanoate hydroxymethyltransferase
VVVLTCYDSAFAALVDEAVDVVLVGDSVANVCLGQPSTRTVTMDAMIHHSAAVRTSLHSAMLVADMPFGSFLTTDQALTNAAALMARGGADAVKLEGGAEMSGTVRALTSRGIPVVGHVGLLPQTAGSITGFRVQGKSVAEAEALLRDCEALAEAGACAIVLELVPDEVATAATALLREWQVPTIGIGAGAGCAGQVLVLHDLLGLHADAEAGSPRFAKCFANPPISRQVTDAVTAYSASVRAGTFPSAAESFPMAEAARVKFQALHPHLLPVPDAAVEPVGISDARIAVVGAGAMGSLFAGRMQQANLGGVQLVSARLLSELGGTAVHGPVRIEIHGGGGPASTTVPVGTGASANQAELVVVAVRNEESQLAGAVEKVQAIIAARAAAGAPVAVLMLQNGLGAAEHMQRALGASAIVLDCVSSEGASLQPTTEAGVVAVRATGGAGTTVGALPDARLPEGITPIAAQQAQERAVKLLNEAGIPTTGVTPHAQMAARLVKQGVSLSLVATAAVAGVTNGQVLKQPQLESAMRAMAEEAAGLLRAEAARCALEEVELWQAATPDKDVVNAILREAEAIARATATNTCSLLASRQRGDSAELEATLGWAVRAAEAHSLPIDRLGHAYATLQSAARALR